MVANTASRGRATKRGDAVKTNEDAADYAKEMVTLLVTATSEATARDCSESKLELENEGGKEAGLFDGYLQYKRCREMVLSRNIQKGRSKVK